MSVIFKATQWRTRKSSNIANWLWTEAWPLVVEGPLTQDVFVIWAVIPGYFTEKTMFTCEETFRS